MCEDRRPTCDTDGETPMGACWPSRTVGAHCDGDSMENDPRSRGPGSLAFCHGTKADLRPGDVLRPGTAPTLVTEGRRTTTTSSPPRMRGKTYASARARRLQRQRSIDREHGRRPWSCVRVRERRSAP